MILNTILSKNTIKISSIILLKLLLFFIYMHASFFTIYAILNYISMINIYFIYSKIYFEILSIFILFFGTIYIDKKKYSDQKLKKYFILLISIISLCFLYRFLKINIFNEHHNIFSIFDFIKNSIMFIWLFLAILISRFLFILFLKECFFLQKMLIIILIIVYLISLSIK